METKKTVKSYSPEVKERAATAKTDGWAGYSGAPGITHDPHVVGRMAAHIVLPWTHRVFANLKRWALGVYHGLRRKPRSVLPR